MLDMRQDNSARRSTQVSDNDGSASADDTSGAAGVTASSQNGQPPEGDFVKYRDQARELVPEIGEGRRWYDRLYKVVKWLLHGKRRRFLPRPVREQLGYALVSLHSINHRDQYRVWNLEDEMQNYIVPDEEHASFPSVWVVELFPPSRYEELLKASKRNAWNKERDILQRDQNVTMLEASRGGGGLSWWRLAEIADPRAPYAFGNGIVEELPPPFISVELRAITVGPSLTAVVGRFVVDPAADNALDEFWHTNHDPVLVRRGNVLHAEDRMWAGFRLTQRKRQVLHDAARAWMKDKIPGFFATSDEPQLLLDLCLTDVYDPTATHRDRDHKLSDAFRALGLIRFEDEYKISPDLPGLILLPADGRLCRNLEHRNVWTLWGQTHAVKEAFADDWAGRGSDTGRAISDIVDDRIRMFLVGLSLTAYTAAAKRQHAELRDNASGGYRRFRAGQLRKLRRALLNLSIDLAGMERDARAFWARESRWDPIVQFAHVEAPGLIERLREHGIQPRAPLDYNRFLRRNQRRELQALVEADDSYRDILSTVSALGASADSTRVGRAALAVAAASLVLSGVIFWTTVHSDNSNEHSNQHAIGQHR